MCDVCGRWSGCHATHGAECDKCHECHEQPQNTQTSRRRAASLTFLCSQNYKWDLETGTLPYNSTVPSFLWNIRKNNILKNIFYLNLDIVPELEHKQPRHKEGVCMLHDKYVNIWRVRTKFLSLLLLVVSVCMTAAWHQHCVRSTT